MQPPALPAEARGRPPLPPPRLPKAVAPDGSLWVPVAVGILIAMFGVVAIGGMSVLAFGGRSAAPTVAARDNSAKEAAAQSREVQPAATANPAEANEDRRDSNDATNPPATPANPDRAVAKAEVADKKADAPKAEPGDLKPAVPAASRPLDDVRQRKNLLPIAGEGIADDQMLLCRIKPAAAKDVQIELVHHEFDDSVKTVLELARVEQEQAVLWEVSQRGTKGLSRPEKPGVFSFVSGELRFRWNADTDRSFLPFCALRISVRGSEPDAEVCRLWKPIVFREARVSFGKPTALIDVTPPRTLLPSDNLKLKVDLENWPAHEFRDGQELLSGKRIEFSLKNPDPDGLALMTVHLELRVDHGLTQLQMQPRVKLPRVRIKGSTVDDKPVEEAFSKGDLERFRSETEKTSRQVTLLIDRKVDPAIEAAERQLGQLARQVTPQALLTKAEKTLTDLQHQREQLEAAQATLSRLTDWNDAAAKAIEEIETNGRVRLRLVRQTRAGDEIEVLATSAPNRN